MSQPRITAFAGTANGNTQPLRTISGQATLQGRTNHQMAFDALHDEIIVPNPFAQAIVFFKGDANGEATPIRVIQGPKTELNYTDNVAVDPVNNEVITAQRRTNSIMVHKRLPGGDEPPVRVLHGPKTRLDRPYRVSVDAVNNLLAVTDVHPEDRPEGCMISDEGKGNRDAEAKDEYGADRRGAEATGGGADSRRDGA